MSNSDTEDHKPIKSIDSWMEGDMLFLREQDKIQVRSIPTCLTEDNPYAALCGPRVDLLNYYFEYLYAQLKANDHYQLEVFFSVTTDALLEFYNKRLADISVNAAKSATDSELERKILVISDCTAMAKSEWDLLARLLIDFPGANCGLLIICEEPFNQEVDAFCKLLGSRLTRCYCNFPDPRELVGFLDASAMTPYHSHNKKKLAALGITGADLEVDQEVDLSIGRSDESGEDFSTEVEGEKKFNKLLFFTFTLILFIAFGVAYQLNQKNEPDFEAVQETIAPDRDASVLVHEDQDMLPEESLDYVSDPVIKDEIDDASLSSEENTAGQAIDLSTETEDLSDSIVRDSNTNDLSNEVYFEEQSATVEEDTLSPIIADAISLPNNPSGIEQVLEEQVVDQPQNKFDYSIDTSVYYLQHAALSSQAAAKTAISEVFTDFSSAFPLPQFSQKKLWHVVFSGPYATRADAMNVAKENGVTADVVIVRGEYIVSRVPSEVEDDGR